MRFSLRQLEVFLATARLNTLSRAAESLALSQSAASSALQDLESRYSTQLFDRVGKRLKLNAAGRQLFPAAENLLKQAEAVDALLAGQEGLGSLTIGATMTIGNYLAVALISRYRRLYPQVDIRLHVANTTEIAQMLLAYDLDMGFLEGEYPHPDLRFERWRSDELVIFCSPKHPFASKAVIEKADLLQSQWILRERGSGTRQAFERALPEWVGQLQIDFELEHTEAIKRAVEEGESLGCLSRITVQDGLQSGRFVELPLQGVDMQRSFYLVSNKQKFRDASLASWLDYCQQQGEEGV